MRLILQRLGKGLWAWRPRIGVRGADHLTPWMSRNCPHEHSRIRTRTIPTMARPERRIVLAGASPARVSAGAPGSRLRSRGEIRAAKRSVKSPCKRGEQSSGLQQSVNAIASTNYQPKGVWESRASHVTAKATDSILDRNECWILPGVSGGDWSLPHCLCRLERLHLIATVQSRYDLAPRIVSHLHPKSDYKGTPLARHLSTDPP
jgi:hypothetical protein